VLLLEADAQVRALMRAWLAPLGYRLLEAEGPVAARAMLAAADPRIDLLITGIALMGGGDGAALAAEVRRRHPGTAVLIVSGYVQPSRGEAAAPPGVRLLAKPFSRRHLTRMVGAALADRDRSAA
jgi:DNA-binding NtrC family response regulator